MSDKYLSIYFNDHLAITTGAHELLNRTLENNRDTELGKLVEALAIDAEQERQAIESLMSEQGIAHNPIKTAGAWLAERIGRLKLNGEISGYSDLSRLAEIEGIGLALESKRAFWDALNQVGFTEAGGLVTKSLARRAEQQIEELETHRRVAAKNALGLRAPSLAES
jgi:hypothetical protein